MRWLFVKQSLDWPRSSGTDVHASEMMRALGNLGHDVHLATLDPPDTRALIGLGLTSSFVLNGEAPVGRDVPIHLTGLQERYRSYYGVSSAAIAQVGSIAESISTDAVVLAGLDMLPYIGSLHRAARVWYAADESVHHHLTLVRLLRPSTWVHMKHALIKGLYERAFAPVLDRVWVVSESERTAMRRYAGAMAVDVLPNGVDGAYFSPVNTPEVPCSAVFWGRLDFEPNVQALQWFARQVWPRIRKRCAEARFVVLGFRPRPEVESLVREEGFDLRVGVPDIRPDICAAGVAVMPFVSGGGIKNKLLEAAALARPIVCTPHACGGLRGLDEAPLLVDSDPSRLAERIVGLWQDAVRRSDIGARTRTWVLKHHTWAAVADEAARQLEESVGGDARQ